MSSTSSFYTIINDVWDTANHALKMVISMVHTHSATAGQGGQLDWDDIWSDAVHSHQSNAEGSTLDHGLALTGLTDDDHTQYQKEDLLTTAGDMSYATGASVWARLGIGTAGQLLRTNAAATAPEWAAEVVPSGLIAMWHGLIANIPSGWVICDGNNGTPNLLAKFVEGVATAATNPGTTGGATSKTTAGHVHTSAAHTHEGFQNGVVAGSLETDTDVTVRWDGASAVSAGADATASATPGNTGSQTDSISDIRPLFYDIAFIMKT
mgnify:CR=1 FL=1